MKVFYKNINLAGWTEIKQADTTLPIILDVDIIWKVVFIKL
jgi:hypothetical protein